MSPQDGNLDLARRYLAAIERGDDADAVGQFLHSEVVADEFPNRLVPSGARRDRAALLEGVERGRKLMRSQCYEVTDAVADGPHVALEIDWQGTLDVAFGEQMPAGTTLRARLAVFLEFRDGQIVSQRNYDCYEPW